MLNVCWYDNAFTEPSLHDDGLVSRLEISTSMVKIYKHLCSTLPVIRKKINRCIFIL